MAARENQGLQISLIIFVMLTIILSVTTFIFFNNYKDELVKTKKAEETAKQSDDKERLIREERVALLQIAGYPETEAKADYEKRSKDEIQKYNEFFKLQLPDDQKNYTKLVEQLAKTIDSKHKEVTSAQAEVQALKKERDDEKVKFAGVVDVHSKDKSTAQSTQKTDKVQFDSQVSELDQSKTVAATQITAKDKQYQDLKATSAKVAQDLSQQVKKLSDTIANKTKQVEDLQQETPSIPDGRVAFVNQRDNLVWVNLGSDDGLQRRITFSVYDKDATNAATAIKKGSIEILNIRDRHLAEARIIENASNDPIVAGDIIYTPIWHPGQTQHFAIAGLIDFDNDGTSDRAKLRDLISINGGVIDAEADEKGKLVGKLNHQTKYLIIGRAPTDKGAEKELEGWTTLNTEAKKLGVPLIKLDEFLAQISYTPRSTSQVSSGGGPKIFRNNNTRLDNNKDSGDGFKSRRPPTKGDSAFESK